MTSLNNHTARAGCAAAYSVNPTTAPDCVTQICDTDGASIQQRRHEPHTKLHGTLLLRIREIVGSVLKQRPAALLISLNHLNNCCKCLKNPLRPLPSASQSSSNSTLIFGRFMSRLENAVYTKHHLVSRSWRVQML